MNFFKFQLMGVEVAEKYGGTGCNFMVTVLTVEELSKVDPAVATLVAVHNTLVCSLIMKVASEEHKQKYLPILAQQKVSKVKKSSHMFHFTVISLSATCAILKYYLTF